MGVPSHDGDADVRNVRPKRIAVSVQDWRSVYVLSEIVGDLPILDVGLIGGDMEPRELRSFMLDVDGAAVVSLNDCPEISMVVMGGRFSASSYLHYHEHNPTELLSCNVLDFRFVCDGHGCLEVRYITSRLSRRVLAELEETARKLSRKPLIDLTAPLDRVVELVLTPPNGPDDIVEVPRTFGVFLEHLKLAHRLMLGQGPAWRGGLTYVRRLHLLLRGLLASAGVEVAPFMPNFPDVEAR